MTATLISTDLDNDICPKCGKRMTATEICDSYAEENQRFHDEIERLRAALKPFADLAGKLDAAPNLVGLLTEEDFKRAAAALDHEQGATDGGN